jgi:hypothetical protein
MHLFRSSRWSISHVMLGAILAATAPAIDVVSAQTFNVIDNFDDGNDTGWSRFVQGWLNTDEGAWSIVTGRYNMRSTLNVPSGESGTVLSVLDASSASLYRNGTWKTKVRINNLVCSASIYTRAAFNSQGLAFCYALDIHASNAFSRSVELYRLDGNSDTLLGSISRTNLNISGNTDYWVEYKTDGSTITVKIWQDGSTAPSSPQISVTDSTYETGRLVLTGYKSDNLGSASINVSYDDLQFASIAAPPPPPPPPVIGDFNGDRTVDMIWRNKSTGFNVIWLCDQTPGDGSFVQSSASLTTVAGSQWTIVGRADFNNDGKTDILWRNTTTGDNTVWFMDGTSFVSAGSIFSVADPNWVIAGIADFNSDSRPDLLWRNVKTGDNTVWLLNGTAVANAVSIPSVTDRSWHAVAAGDLTGDGISDILWRNHRTGAISVWEMNNTTYVAARSLTAGVSDVNWQVADLADFTGDGNLDIVWRNTLTGTNVLWQMNDLAFVSASNLPTITDLNWSVSGMSDQPRIKKDDFDGNGFADVVWRNTSTGENSLWLMTAANALGGAATLPTVAGSNWRIQAVGDINRDNLPDIIWRDTTGGSNIAWLMNGSTRVATVNLPSVPAPWQIVGLADANADGTNDLYWRNSTTGENVAWLLDGTPGDSAVVSGTLSFPSVVGDTWVLQGVAKVDTDQYPDLVWRNTSTGNSVSGINVVWLMTSNQIRRSVDMPAITDQNWQIGKVSDMNDDGYADLLWRNSVTGDNSIWLLDPNDNDLYTGFLAFPRVSDLNWKIED